MILTWAKSRIDAGADGGALPGRWGSLFQRTRAPSALPGRPGLGTGYLDRAYLDGQQDAYEERDDEDRRRLGRVVAGGHGGNDEDHDADGRVHDQPESLGHEVLVAGPEVDRHLRVSRQRHPAVPGHADHREQEHPTDDERRDHGRSHRPATLPSSSKTTRAVASPASNRSGISTTVWSATRWANGSPMPS